MLFKITCFSIQLLLLLAADMQADYAAVIKSRILEMNNSFPPPHNQPVSPGTNGCSSAPQGLYNEVVNCIAEHDSYIKISYDNITYRTDTIPSTFWTYKDGLLPLTELEASDLALAIPNPKYAEEPTIVLIYPWKGFSLGTRFKHLPEYDTQDAYAIIWADYTESKIHVA